MAGRRDRRNRQSVGQQNETLSTTTIAATPDHPIPHRSGSIWDRKLTRGVTLGGAFLAIALFVWGVFKPQIEGSLGELLRPEIIDLELSIQPYDIQMGFTGPSSSVGMNVRGDRDKVERVLREDTVGQISSAVKGETAVEATLTLSDFRLRSSQPLTLVVSELGAAGPLQVEPGVRQLNEQDADLRNFFESGKFFQHDCQCIYVTLRDGSGRFTGGPDRIYFVDKQASFSPQSVTPSLDAKLRREQFTIALFITTPGASEESGPRISTMIRQTLKNGLEEHEFIRVSPFQTMEEIDLELERLNNITLGPEKILRTIDSSVDEVLFGTATIEKDWFFRK